MQALLTELRKAFFSEIARTVPKINVQFVILTHILEDRPELLSAIQTIAPISLLIGIPYSTHNPTLQILQEQYTTINPTLDLLLSEDYLTSQITKYINLNTPTIILDIGGYFAPALKTLQNSFNGKLLGVIEDTEAGHKRYMQYINEYSCPIISVARSSLKNTEDFLVGSSCLFSTEKLLRKGGFPIDGKRSLTLGFGKVGRGITHALLRRHCPVLVYDTNPICKINALSEGFQIPNKIEAIKNAEIIYGATGVCSIKAEDYKYIRSGTVLVSCSSKNNEFDLEYLNKNYQINPIFEGLDCYTNNHHSFYLANQGQPVNFIDGAIIGPVLALVQAEIILAINMLATQNLRNGIFEVDLKTKEILAEKWLDHFCDGKSGHYRINQSKKLIQSKKIAEAYQERN